MAGEVDAVSRWAAEQAAADGDRGDGSVAARFKAKLGTTASKLEGDVVYMDYSAAIATMEAATGQMACMTERATPEALARFWYVGGVAAARGGRTRRPP